MKKNAKMKAGTKRAKNQGKKTKSDFGKNQERGKRGGQLKSSIGRDLIRLWERPKETASQQEGRRAARKK